MMSQPAQLKKTIGVECVDLVDLVYEKTHIFILARNKTSDIPIFVKR
jgi:hypothetical protein